jgi:outer membrane protein OmpA-like peptidoglycan-associated protein
VKINYSNETLELLGYDDPSSLYPDKVKPRNQDGDLASQVLKMLEINNSKMDAMQAQINDLRADQLAMMEARQNEKNTEMQSQIDDLRGMVIDLVRMNTGSSLANNGTGGNISPTPNYNTVSNVPSAINIFFAKGITKPDVASKMALNEVVDILARNPRLKLIITGFADKSGSALDNLLISQERAREVKQFLSASGLTEDRFITKYFGDRDSQTESAGDRKVVLEFVQ